MKKVLLAVVAIAVLGISSCKKEEGAKPQIKNETNKVAGRTLTTYDWFTLSNNYYSKSNYKQNKSTDMKKVLLAVVAIAVLGISSCKKEEGAKPQIKNETNKVAGRTLTTYDWFSPFQ